MKLFRKVVDERQELEMMRVERVGFWVIFFGLAAAITVQIFAFDFEIAHIAGEFIVLMVGSIVMLVGDIRSGSWDYFTKPGIKAYLVYSIVGSVIFGLVAPLTRFFRYGAPISDCLRIFVINTAILFPITFLLLWLWGSVTKKRQAKLQQEMEEDA